MKGQVNPKINTGADINGSDFTAIKASASNIGPAFFPAQAITKKVKGALGLATTKKVICFTRDATIGGSTVVSGVLLGTDIMVDFLKGMGTAKALAWDKDQTMYVADEANAAVYGFPIGRVMTNAPRTLAVHQVGAFGLAITSSADPWFNGNTVNSIHDLASHPE